MSDRSDLIVQHFEYLVKGYSFRIERKKYDAAMMGNAVVVFKSAEYGIQIAVDRDQVFISIGQQSDPATEWFGFNDVVKYYAPNVDTVYVFPDKTPQNTWDNIIEIQLTRLAGMLREYCEPLLKGEPWPKKSIQQIEEKRVAEMLKKWGQNTG